MPRLISQHSVSLEWSDIRLYRPRRPTSDPNRRTPGIHLSGIIRKCAEAMGKLDKYDKTDEMPLCVAVGVFWENGLMGLPHMRDVDWQPGEWLCQGVYGTPDGKVEKTEEEEQPGECKECGWPFPGERQEECRTCHGDGIRADPVTFWSLVEVKYTWKSNRTRQDITQEWMWMAQLAGNCYALGLERAELHVMWANGAYPWGAPSPEYIVYDLEFPIEETGVFWQNVILNNRDGVEAER